MVGVGATAVALYLAYDSFKGKFANAVGKKKKKKKKGIDIIPKTPKAPKTTCPDNVNVRRAKQECNRRKGSSWNSEKCRCEQDPIDPRTQNIPKPTMGQGITNAVITPVWNPSTNPNLGLGCFIAGTSVSMSDGTSKNIEDVRVGDSIYTWNEKDEVKEVCQVLREINLTKDKIYTIKFADSNMSFLTTSLSCTGEHPIYIKEKGWVIAENLNEGDIAQNIDGGSMVVKSISISIGDTKVYNLSVKGNHNYYANKILVHNKDTADGQTYSGQQAVAVFTAIQQAYDQFMAGDTSVGDETTINISSSQPRIAQSIKDI